MRQDASDRRMHHELDELGESLLRTSEVAQLLQVSSRTVTGWARSGRIECVRIPGGHWRFRRTTVRTLLGEITQEAR